MASRQKVRTYMKQFKEINYLKKEGHPYSANTAMFAGFSTAMLCKQLQLRLMSVHRGR